MKPTILLVMGLCLMSISCAEEFDMRKALQKCYSIIPTDKYGAWAAKEYQGLKEECYRFHKDALCRRICFLTDHPHQHHPVFAVIAPNKNGEWNLPKLTSNIIFDIVGVDSVSNAKLVPPPTPDNPNPKETTVKAAISDITDKLNVKMEKCVSKVFIAADGKADSCEKLGEEDRKKLTDLVNCIESVLTC